MLVIGVGPSRLHRMVQALLCGDLNAMRSQLSGLGPRAVLALVALVLAHTVLPFPAELLAAAGGFALAFSCSWEVSSSPR